jgi:membrane protease subunit HflK
LGNAERFTLVVTEYRKAPQVTRERLYLDAMQEILSNSTKVLVEKGGNNMLYLPLDKLIQMSGSANTEAGAASHPASTPAAPSLTPHNSNNAASPISAAPGASDMSVPRSRDNLRSRERESRP